MKKSFPPPPHPSGAQPPELPKNLIPKHVALVMDGNGRWAQERGLPRTAGHEAGEASLLDCVHGALELGIGAVSAYAFSTENWRRSPEEVRFLMGFNRDVIRRRRDEMNELGVRIRWAGRRPKLWRSVIKELEEAEKLTAKNSQLTLTMCVNYGGRAEIADAVQAISAKVASGQIQPSKITERMIAAHLDEPDMPDVDLFVPSTSTVNLHSRHTRWWWWASLHIRYTASPSSRRITSTSPAALSVCKVRYTVASPTLSPRPFKYSWISWVDRKSSNSVKASATAVRCRVVLIPRDAMGQTLMWMIVEVVFCGQNQVRGFMFV